MNPAKPEKVVVTVAEMARLCGLSRSRFYMLLKEGIMPPPSRNEVQRPFYTREQQEQCLLVRRTSCGINGRPVLFYARAANRGSTPPSRHSRPVVRRPPPSPARKLDPLTEELLAGLEQLGVTSVTGARIREVLAAAYPDGHANVGVPTLLMTVFRRLKSQDAHDNVAG